MTITHKDYLKIAFPFIISTVTQPLLGAVDTAVIGQLGIAELIGGVAIGTIIMNTMYWLFGFFRVSTTGQSAMALGKGSRSDLAGSLMRPFVQSNLRMPHRRHPSRNKARTPHLKQCSTRYQTLVCKGLLWLSPAPLTNQ